MVFSHSNQKPQSVLKVIDIDRLKPGKSPQVKVAYEPRDSHELDAALGLPPETLRPEEFLNSEPLFEDKMYRESDCEFFQDLGLWCSDPAKEEQTTITEPLKKLEDRAHTTDTPHTPFSPLEWEMLEPPVGAAPLVGGQLAYDKPTFAYDAPEHKYLQQQFIDLNSLPVVFGEETAAAGFGPTLAAPAWSSSDAEPVQIHPTPFIDQEDSLELDMKYITWSRDTITKEAFDNDVVVSEFIIEDKPQVISPLWPPVNRAHTALKLDVAARPVQTDTINTPDLLSCVEQLENETFGPLTVIDNDLPEVHSVGDSNLFAMDVHSMASPASPVYPKIEVSSTVSKTESPADSSCDEEPHRKRRRRRSEDSDETYVPSTDRQSTRKYRRRKPSIPIEDLILALEDSQQQNRVRRGRPPKRRESTVSSIGSVDDASRSSLDVKYRELRDKNNEASKRSRMNRKLKELQMEHLADDLEKRNRQLRLKADILEDLTKKLKDALMQAMLNK